MNVGDLFQVLEHKETNKGCPRSLEVGSAIYYNDRFYFESFMALLSAGHYEDWKKSNGRVTTRWNLLSRCLPGARSTLNSISVILLEVQCESHHFHAAMMNFIITAEAVKIDSRR